jgi:selenide,water dikinase
VYRIDGDRALVEDPFLFGKIATANALSDIYAMGGTPLYALILTKALGAGLVMAALRAGEAPAEIAAAAAASMERLNRYAAEKLAGRAVHGPFLCCPAPRAMRKISTPPPRVSGTATI